MADFVAVVRSLLSADNTVRNQAEACYNDLVQQSPGDVATRLLDILARHRDPNDAALR